MELEARLIEEFVKAHPANAARVLERLPPDQTKEVLTGLAPIVAGALLGYLLPATAAQSLRLASSEEAARTLGAARPDVAAPIARLFDREQRGKILGAMPRHDSDAIRDLIRYSQGTAGALMDPAVLGLPDTWSVGEALEHVRKHPQHAIYYLYVVSDQGHLVGVLNLRELMLASQGQALGSIAKHPVESLSAKSSWQTVVAHPGWKRVHALPVTETDGRFVGMIRYESVRNLEQRLAKEDDEDHTSRTGAALSEVYGLGLRGLVQWAALLVGGPGRADTEQEQR